MAITNTSKPSTSITNIPRVSFSETWGTILTTWSGETRTWDGTISLIGNVSRPTTSMTNTSKPS